VVQKPQMRQWSSYKQEWEKMNTSNVKSKKKNINVSIPNVISWYRESESCLLHNHAERIPLTRHEENTIIQDIIEKYDK
jgi:hypothetical protein